MKINVNVKKCYKKMHANSHIFPQSRKFSDLNIGFIINVSPKVVGGFKAGYNQRLRAISLWLLGRRREAAQGLQRRTKHRPAGLRLMQPLSRR